MEEMASLWSYQETMDEMRQKLLYTTIELQRLKAQSREETRKSKEYMDQLVQLVHTVIRERDEARNHIQKILNSSCHRHAAGRANSGLTESNNSLSDTQNHYCSSPVESLLDPVSSPVESNSNVHQRVVHGAGGLLDQGSLVIDSLAKGKPLPEKGRFLNAVLEAGPLLQTHLLAGPLPRWRNPPQLKAFHIPQVSLRNFIGDEDEVLAAHSRMVMLNNGGASQQPYFEMSCGSSQMHSSSAMLNFGNNLASGSCGGNQVLISAGSDVDCYGHMGKRQRLL
ncbi:unnamed protein product [Cuscuta epithymum]|uniref:Uncharacterized protein n=1 Tax=Cuscuta epithymum TaxID=186058 RepID=A0AAV0GHI2_9ASTE|nr:unnamed protein product [Cuscuta epithymum]CAH9147315.1 unnamed protein product [Cuscuta epithymum]